MTDLGTPFRRDYAGVVAALQERIRRGVEQRGRIGFVVDPGVDSYELPRNAHEVLRVTGMVAAAFTMFERGEHYRVAGNHITWHADAQRPDEGTHLEVEYLYRSPPAGLSDFNPGSVVGTLAGAVARELTAIHNQIDEAYRRAFVDHASGAALDNVVALLGVERIPATRAGGTVTFARRRPGEGAVEITVGTRISGESGRLFATTEPGEIAEEEAETDVPVEAVEAGPDGNVNAGTLVVMPTPPPGVDSVVNPEPVTGGHDPEPDDQLRERAKHALERAGNATLNAIRNAVLGLPGVQGATVIDHSVDASLPLGEVRVRHAGGEPEEIRQTVERTRAAGVLAQIERVVEVWVSGRFVLIPDPDVPAGAAASFIAEVRVAIDDKAIGESLSVRHLEALAFGIDGLADVAEAQLAYRRDTDDEEAELPDPFPTGGGERVRVAEDALEAVLVTGLAVTSAGPAGDGHRLDLQLVDQAGQPVDFRHLTMRVDVAISGIPRSAPEQRDELGGFDRELVFDRAHTATIVTGEVPGFDPGRYEPQVELKVSTPVYPGLQPATTSLELGGQPDEPQ
jgi:uncharacterized phage protein gp47/JayE